MDKDIIHSIARVIEAEVQRLEADAEQALKAGEADFGKLKAFLAAEFAKLAEALKAIGL